MPSVNKKPTSVDKKFEFLEQYDYIDDEIILKEEDDYAELIGKFMIHFSSLEHTINQVVANSILDRAHATGYAVIESLYFFNKVNLFYKLYLSQASYLGKKEKIVLLS